MYGYSVITVFNFNATATLHCIDNMVHGCRSVDTSWVDSVYTVIQTFFHLEEGMMVRCTLVRVCWMLMIQKGKKDVCALFNAT
jgi:hypothetical protein